MIQIQAFDPCLAARLPETAALLQAANLWVHPAVVRLVLHGSRGPAGTYRPDSDIDLSLLVDAPAGADPAQAEPLAAEVFQTTWEHWRGAAAVDLAVIFATRPCGLVCFDYEAWDAQPCRIGGVDCFGLYKVQKGFHGLVTNAGIEVRRMYPCLKIWQRL